MAQFNRNDKREDEFSENVVALAALPRPLKAAESSGFAALVVVGDSKGTVGFGLGKASEVPDAIAEHQDAKNLVGNFSEGTTIARGYQRVRCRPRSAPACCSRYRRYASGAVRA